MKLPHNNYTMAQIDRLKDMADHKCSLQHISAAMEIPEKEVLEIAKRNNVHVWIGRR